MSDYGFDAVIFDLDGVVTQTALVHSAAWKSMFDKFLKKWSEENNRPFVEFDKKHEYLFYVDGKPRYKGVQSFLEYRGIFLPYGDPSDSTDNETICGIGNRKNIVFNDVLKKDGAKVYDSTVNLIRELIEKKIRVGIASSSKNCKAVLEAAGILELFETRVDGVVSAELGLNGKPEPDIFTTACDNLGVTYDRAVIVEDAVSGVQAGKSGNFGLVLGIAREENEKELKLNGADIVVKNIADIGFEGITEWFAFGLEKDEWSITYLDYDKKKERSREVLLTVGNGYFGTRGAMEETDANNVNYPGTYVAGLYNRLKSQVAGREIENEDFVNIPNWLPITFRINEKEWFDPNNFEILDISRNLDFRTGLLTREITIKDKDGRETLIQSRRFISMDNPHLAAFSYSITPLNYSGKITVRSGLNGDIINAGVERYKQLNQQHLEAVSENGNGKYSDICVKTTQSGVSIAEAARLNIFLDEKEIYPEIICRKSNGKVYSEFEIEVNKNAILNTEKFVAIYTSKEEGVSDFLEEARALASCSGSFKNEFEAGRKKWEQIWDRIDIKIEGDRLSQKLLRLHLYHLIVSFSPYNEFIDASITARGLHGEAYRGHIFWDELFILPFYAMHFPKVARSMLMYRYRRLKKAREYAAECGYRGAMFPWQSGSDGREETQVIHLNPVSGKWGDDYSSLQRHVSLAVAYNIWEYYQISGDTDFIEKYGAEMFLDICRFWASKCRLDEDTGRYSIGKVMGPDEFHEAYPGSSEGGIRDNAYTNLMVAWSMQRAFDLLKIISESAKNAVFEKLKLSKKELERWKDISKNLKIVIKDNILAQYDGYFDLKELDWDYYRKKYGNISRMDRLLKAEGKSADEYKVAKQADTLMVFYNLSKEEVDRIIENLGYSLKENYLRENLEYYLQRTSHGSTLSRVVHAQLANIIGDSKLSWEMFSDALLSDFNDIQGGTTGEGIHAGVMAGTILVALRSYAGLDIRSGIVKISPNLPSHWRSVKFNFMLKGNYYSVDISSRQIKICYKGKTDEEKIYEFSLPVTHK